MEKKTNCRKCSENELERTYLIFKDKYKKLAEKHSAEARELASKHDKEFDEFYEEVKSALTNEEMDFIEIKMKSEEKNVTKEIIEEIALYVYDALKEIDKNDN